MLDLDARLCPDVPGFFGISRRRGLDFFEPNVHVLFYMWRTLSAGLFDIVNT